jgi:hypothetical protein
MDAAPERSAESSPQRWSKCGGTVLMLVAFDVCAFAAAIWLATCVPEALESAARSANASTWSFAGPVPNLFGPAERAGM